MSQANKPSTVVWYPEAITPKLTIPHEIATQWMMYGRIGYEDHNSEWGCAVRLVREGNEVEVVDWEPYKIDASGAYWESIEGERERHTQALIDAGKEDELCEWNGLFHTHPIGSGASMSTTDRDQLEDMAKGGWWAISIISPANKEGVVHPDKFLYHCSDDRGRQGCITVGNLRPTIKSPQFETLTLVRDHMKELMVKRPRTTGAPKAGSGGWSQGMIWDGAKREWVYAESSSKDLSLIPSDQYRTVTDKDLDYASSFRAEPSVGDWVYVDKLDSEQYLMDAMSDKEKNELSLVPGMVGEVIEETTMGQITVDFHCKEVTTKWVLDPKVHEDDTWGDDVFIAAKRYSLDANLLRTAVKNGIEPKNNACISSVIKRINSQKKTTA